MSRAFHPIRLVLRWRGERTLEAHAELLAVRNYVWWSWWRKDDEPLAIDVLERLASELASGAVSIGLINREQDLFARAECIDLFFGRDGERVELPAAEVLPQYLPRPDYPAFFQLVRIDRLKPEEYHEHFGPVPVGDPTIYEVRRAEESERKELVPGPLWNLRPVPLRRPQLLHLSDLHFGLGHGYRVGAEQPGTSVRRPRLVERVEAAVEDAGNQVGLVMVTGDLISRAEYASLDEVEDFLDEICRRLDLTRDHVLLIPGNHDFDVLEGTTERERVLLTTDYRHEKRFKQFIRSFYAEDTPSDLERVKRFRFADKHDLVLFSLNSVRIRSPEFESYGYVGQHRYKDMVAWATTQLAAEGRLSESTTLGALMHHHLLPVSSLDEPTARRPISVTLDARQITDDFESAGVNVVFHGHQHIPFIGDTRRYASQQAWKPTERNRLVVVGCGSSGINPATIVGFARNSLGIYDWRDGELNYQLYAYSPTDAPERLADGVVPLSRADI
jgi:3',5'-cyclic AMP phosphodiesterase CpdA